MVAVALCMLFIEDSLHSSDEVVPFIKLPVILKFYCHCLEKLKAPVVSVNATRLKENFLELNPHLETTSHNKEVFNSFKNNFEVPLQYSREHSLQNKEI